MTGDCRLNWPYLSDLDIIGNVFSSFRTRVLVMLNLVKGDNVRTKTKADARHGRSLLVKTGTGVNSTHEGACPRSTLLQLAPGANCTNDFYRKNKLRNKTFAPSYETRLIWGSKLQGQICCTSLFQEQPPLCVLKFACRDMTCLQSNWLIFLVPVPQSGCFIIQLPRRVLRVYWLGYLPGSVFLERVSGARSLVCTRLTCILRVIISSSRSLCCLPSVKKQKHDYSFLFNV